MMLVAMLGVLSLVCPGSVHAGSRRRWADVTLQKGFYSNVLIAVNRDVPETEGMIENIKVRVRTVNHVASYLFLWLFPSSGVAAMVVDRLFPVSPVSFIALSQSYSLHVPLAHLLPPCLW